VRRGYHAQKFIEVRDGDVAELLFQEILHALVVPTVQELSPLLQKILCFLKFPGGIFQPVHVV
jgi:hypothetical protein